MHHFFSRHIEGERIQLDEGESTHAVRVLRLKEGERIVVHDGKGHLYESILTKAHPRHAEARIERTERYGQRASWHLHLAIAPTKSFDRFSMFLEKATEVGVDVITPLLCERSERKSVRHDRMEKVLIAAMKQSGQPFLPRLEEASPYETFVGTPREGDLFIAHCCEHEDPDRQHLYDAIATSMITLMIGPEGDFTTKEIALARKAGYRSVSLGESRLRTETAGVTATIIAATRFRHRTA